MTISLAFHFSLQSKPDSVEPDGDVVLFELEHIGQLHFIRSHSSLA